MRTRVRELLNRYSHLTYIMRVLIALCIGLMGVTSVYAFIGVQSLDGLRTTLTAAVAGSKAPHVEDTPILVSGIRVRGEVMPERELALSARASGIISEAPRSGTSVAEGSVVFRVESGAAERAVKSAEVAVSSARLTAELNRRTSALAMSSDASARSAATDELADALQAGWDEAGEILPLLPDVISGLSGLLYGGEGFGDDENALMRHAGVIEGDNEAIRPLSTRAGDLYVEAKRDYESVYALFHIESRPNDEQRETLITKTGDSLETLEKAVTASRELYAFIKNHRSAMGYHIPSVFESYDESLTNYEEQLRNQKSVISGTATLVEAAHAILEGQLPPASSPESADLEIRRAQVELDEARSKMAAHAVRAPFSGTLAKVEKRVGEYVNDGENVALLISRTNVVRVYLAQGEAARVNVGTRVLVTIEGTDISMPGVVEEMDGKGERNADGDVVFTTVIALQEADERLKPGMEVLVGFEAQARDPRS